MKEWISEPVKINWIIRERINEELLGYVYKKWTGRRVNEGVNIRNESSYVLVNDEVDFCKIGC